MKKSKAQNGKKEMSVCNWLQIKLNKFNQKFFVNSSTPKSIEHNVDCDRRDQKTKNKTKKTAVTEDIYQEIAQD